VPQLYLFIEVLAVIDDAMGDKVTSDPNRKILAGHSMGGYGAVMNGMRSNMQYFGSVCALNGGLYIWNLPEFQSEVTTTILDEAIARKEGPFATCNYTQPPYRYYGDQINFNTIIATSLAFVFHDDGTTVPSDNSPYFNKDLFNPDCTVYGQFQGFRFWLTAYGGVNSDMFQVSAWYSPLGFLETNYIAVQKEMNGNIYLSSNLNDTLVYYVENLNFSQALTAYNISHKFDLFPGTHYDIFEGVRGCFSTFAPKICGAPQPPQADTNPIVPFWAFILVTAIALVLLVVVIIQFVSGKKSHEYQQLT